MDTAFRDKVIEKFRKITEFNILLTIPEFEKVILYGKGLSPSAKAIENSMWYLMNKRHQVNKDLVYSINNTCVLDSPSNAKKYIEDQKQKLKYTRNNIMLEMHHTMFYDDMVYGICDCDDPIDKRKYTWGELLFHSYTYKSLCECKYIKPVFKTSEVPALSSYKLYIGECEHLKDSMGCLCALNNSIINAEKLGIENLVKVSPCKYDIHR
jgi:hypothetical protein